MADSKIKIPDVARSVKKEAGAKGRNLWGGDVSLTGGGLDADEIARQIIGKYPILLKLPYYGVEGENLPPYIQEADDTNAIWGGSESSAFPHPGASPEHMLSKLLEAESRGGDGSRIEGEIRSALMAEIRRRQLEAMAESASDELLNRQGMTK